MKWATAISRETSVEAALRECSEAVRSQLGPGPVSLVLAFVAPHFAAYYPRVPEAVARHLAPEVFAGCSGGGVIGGGEEVEWSPAVALYAARLPGVEVTPLRFGDDLPDLDGPPEAWEGLVGVRAREAPRFVLLSDPFSAPTGELLAGLDYAFPGTAKVGGLASGGTSPGTNALFLDGEVFTAGTVGLALHGAVVVDTVVAQGCRPIGPLMQVTSCKGNLLYELDGEPALEMLRDLVAGLDDRDRHLATTALFAGVLMDEFREEPRAGDFLIRNLLGVDPRGGGVAVGENLQDGMRLRFHVRDAASAAEDLHAMLDAYDEATSGTGSTPASGALLFSCLGRGENLYGRPNFDTGVFREHLGDLPVGGFFCNGEIGPVGGDTFLHGYTASFGIFRPAEPA